MERWLSWSKAHDWKSCVPYKGTEGSNPSLSAKKTESVWILSFFVFKNITANPPDFARKIRGILAVWIKNTAILRLPSPRVCAGFFR